MTNDSSGATSPENPFKALIVFDDLEAAEDLAGQLRELGHIAIAIGSDDPIPETFDLAFADGELDETSYSSLRMRAGKRPLIAVVSEFVSDEVERLLEMGFDDLLAAPVTPTSLAAKIAIWSPRAQTSSLLVLDRGVLSELRNLQLENGAPLVPTLVELFVSSRVDVDMLREKFSDGDLAAVHTLAHNLKSSSANLGLVRLKAICHKIELSESASDMCLAVRLLPMEFEIAKRHLLRSS